LVLNKSNNSASEISDQKPALVSVIIPVYNGEETICRAIDSVLGQSYREREVIVVDDGSTDSTVELLRNYGSKIRLVEQKNGGVASARNHGIKLAQGEYVAFLDADDFWVQEKLAIQIEILGRHPSVGLTFSNLEVVNKKGERLGITYVPSHSRNAPSWEDLLTEGPRVLASTVLARREMILTAGGFDADLFTSRGYEDRDLFLRLRELTDFHYLDLCLASYSYDPGHGLLVIPHLFLFARKYWNQPRLQQNSEGRLRKEFVKRCSLEMSWIMRLVLRAEGNKVSMEMLARLNGYHNAFKDLFGDSYREASDCDSIDLTEYKLSPAISLLLYLYLIRSDLQVAFPEVKSGDLSRLADWATAVVKGVYNDGDKPILLTHVSELERLTEKPSKDEKVDHTPSKRVDHTLSQAGFVNISESREG
jgi:glycosyltransferase involved in cell wall biosynthesis